MIVAVSVALAASFGLADRSSAGDRILIEADTVSRDGSSQVRVAPSGAVIMSMDLVAACDLNVLEDEDDVLIFDVDSGTCDTIAGNQRNSDLTLARPALGHGDLDGFDTTDACLDAHHAALLNATTGLATCFRWFECDALEVQVIGPASVCSGVEVMLDAGAGFESYLWSPGGETTQTILVSPWVDTEYLVEVSDEWACAGADVHFLEALPLPEPVIAGPTDMCTGETVTLDAGSGWSSYDWNTGETTRTIAASPLATTAYWVTVMDALTCLGTSIEHVVAVDEVWEAELFDQTIATDTTVRTCGLIWAGPGLEITSPAHLELQAGQTVVFRNGVTVRSGARLTVRLEADLNSP
jgi:hypothetical protein